MTPKTKEQFILIHVISTTPYRSAFQIILTCLWCHIAPPLYPDPAHLITQQLVQQLNHLFCNLCLCFFDYDSNSASKFYFLRKMSLAAELLQPVITGSLLGLVLMILLIIYLISSDAPSQKERTEPPGPRPLPLLGNLLSIDLKRPYLSLCTVSIFIMSIL